MKSSPEVVWRDNVAVIYCPDRIVAGTTEELRSAALDAINNTGRIVLQLESVKYMDSTGLGLLGWLCVSARRRSGDVKLAAPSRHVREILEITKLGRVFSVFPTVDAAVAAFSPATRAEAQQ